ncbi:hypothetical protein BY998_11169 [Methylobacterium sp. B4]|nr:hypothetical protein BY998_11169 [Methylobacterium sp. B4]
MDGHILLSPITTDGGIRAAEPEPNRFRPRSLRLFAWLGSQSQAGAASVRNGRGRLHRTGGQKLTQVGATEPADETAELKN